MTDGGKKLFMVHLGFYDNETGFGAYESHTNVFVAASDAREAKQLAKAMPFYRAKKMHTDSIQEIAAVQGFRIRLEKDAALGDATEISGHSYEDLNPSPVSSSSM